MRVILVIVVNLRRFYWWWQVGRVWKVVGWLRGGGAGIVVKGRV